MPEENNTKSLVESAYIDRGITLSNNIFRKFFLVILFTMFFFPFTISFGSSGVSANYLFALYPATIAFALGKIRLPSQTFFTIIILYVLIFVFATIYQFSYGEFFGRRLVSFIIFMSMFSFIFIKIDSEMVQSFKLAIVSISIIFSLKGIFLYLSLGGEDLGFMAKGQIGSQRFGFVYVLAIWLLWLYPPYNRFLSVLKIFGLLITGVGLLLTFSRSGIVALVGSLGVYIALKIFIWLKRPKLRTKKLLLSLTFIILFISIYYLIINQYFYVTLDFYMERLFSLKQESGADVYDFDNPNSSEGYRIVLFYKILEFVSYNIFTGSGYLGVWILNDDLTGSAHNQYFDVLFRTGIFGLSAYIYMIYSLLKFLYFREPGLFWGLIGILIYGLAHETFKLSQGQFILAFILGMMAQSRPVKSLR